MKRNLWCRRTLLLLAFSCLMLSCTQEPVGDSLAPVPAETAISMESELQDLINAYRLQQGQTALEGLSAVYEKASEHSAYMVQTGEVSHANFYQREAYLKQYARAEAVGENLAVAFYTVEGVFNAWLNSAEHKAILEGDFSHMGLSVKSNDRGVLYYTLIMIRQAAE